MISLSTVNTFEMRTGSDAGARYSATRQADSLPARDADSTGRWLLMGETVTSRQGSVEGFSAYRRAPAVVSLLSDSQKGTFTTTTCPRLKVVVEGIVLAFRGLPEPVLR